jgi:hypothetical protein
MRLTTPLLLIFAVTASALEFEPGRTISSYIGLPEEMVPADLDDDGDLDLVIRSGRKRSVLLFENKGGGTLEQAALWEGLAGETIRGMADFDTDGVPDLLLSTAPDAGEQVELKILFGNGVDGYGPRQKSLGSFADHTLQVDVADVNASGKPDVVTGDSTFIDPGRDQPLEEVVSHAEFVFNPGPHRWADIDTDGLPDVLLSQQGAIYYARNNGGGLFSANFPLFWGSASGVQDVKVEDIHFISDSRLPEGQGFIVVLTDMNTEDQRLSLVGYGEDGMVEFDSLPIGHGSETSGSWFNGFTGTSGKPLLASVFDWSVLPILPEYRFSSTRGSVLEISHSFRRSKPVLVKKTRLSFQGGAGPLVHADLNGDGNDELVTAGWKDGDTASGQLRYYPGKRNGSFAAKPVVVTAPATEDTATQVTDFDGDGDQDLVGRGISLENHTTEIVVWENLGAGSFRRRLLFSGLYDAEIASIADRNGDARPDLLVSGLEWNKKKDEGDRRIVLSLSGKGNKRKVLTLHREAGDSAFDQVRAGDWDGDGVEDLLTWERIAGGSAFEAFWLKGLPGNRYEIPQSLGEGFGEVLQDMDGDGDPDLVPSRRQIRGADAQTGWRENVGADAPPVFHEFPDVAGLEDPQNIFSAEADLNGDGRIDLLAVRDTLEGIYCRPVLLGAGVSFTALPEFPNGEPWFHDMDGDGDRDLLLATRPVAPQPVSGLALLENNGAATFAAPTVIDGAAVGIWQPVLVGDLDGDGKTDVVGSTLDNRPRIEWFKAE